MGNNKKKVSLSKSLSFKDKNRTPTAHLKSPVLAEKHGLEQIQQESVDVGMAASFLQFCATCEKQIFTPSNSLLYCSAACRRQDSVKPLSEAAVAMSLTPTDTPPSSPSIPTRPILPPRLPTGASNSSTSSSLSRNPIDQHNAKSDLDPTEWKPKLSHRRAISNTNSEAFRYLSRFHQSNPSISSSLDSDNNSRMTRSRTSNNSVQDTERDRPLLRTNNTSSTSITSLSTTPQLSRTPTTAASSLSASVELSRTQSSSMFSYDFNTRPLPPRHDPSYHSGSTALGKGIDLVVPHVPPPTFAADRITPVMGWEKKAVGKGSKRDAGLAEKGEKVKEGLGALLEGETARKQADRS